MQLSLHHDKRYDFARKGSASPAILDGYLRLFHEPELHYSLIGLGYFGSYAKGNRGVGSNLDIVDRVRPLCPSRNALPVLIPLGFPSPLMFCLHRGSVQRTPDQSQGGPFPEVLRSETTWIFP